MKPVAVTNDDLGLFVSRKRKSEVYRHSSEVEILQLERDKMDFFFACYFGFSLCVAFYLGVNHLLIWPHVPWLLILWFIGYFLSRKNRRLDGFLSLLASRNTLERHEHN
jgi:hypothetical protein